MSCCGVEGGIIGTGRMSRAAPRRNQQAEPDGSLVAEAAK